MVSLKEKTDYMKKKEKKVVNRLCQYEFAERLRKRNCPSRQVFVPDL